MNKQEIITLCLAIWGAILSTILAIKEFFIEKKKIRISLIEMAYAAEYVISIANVGHRPITIVDINLNSITYDEKIPANARFKEECKLPITLTDGGIPAKFTLTDVLYEEIYYHHMGLLITVYDSEGNSYSKYNTEVFDEKYSLREEQ